MISGSKFGSKSDGRSSSSSFCKAGSLSTARAAACSCWKVKSGKNFCAVSVVVIATVGPKEFRERQDLRVGGAIDALGMGHDQLQNALLPQTESRGLIVDDRIDRDGGFGKPVGQRLFARAEAAKAVRLQLNEAGGTHYIHARAGCLTPSCFTPGGRSQHANPGNKFHETTNIRKLPLRKSG